MKVALNCFNPPKLLMILGTDASGKDYIATRVSTWLNDEGHNHERRVGSLSNTASSDSSSEDKGKLRWLAEAAGFIACYPMLKFLLPVVIRALLQFDLYRFRQTRFFFLRN